MPFCRILRVRDIADGVTVRQDLRIIPHLS